MTRIRSLAPAALAAALLVAGCGDDGKPKAPEGVSQSAFERQMRDAQQVTAADFPAPAGKMLQPLADTTEGGPQVALARMRGASAADRSRSRRTSHGGKRPPALPRLESGT